MLPRDRERRCHELPNFRTRNRGLPSVKDKLASPGRTVIYRAVVADDDHLMPFQLDDVEVVCFIGRPGVVPAGWSAVPCPR